MKHYFSFLILAIALVLIFGCEPPSNKANQQNVNTTNGKTSTPIANNIVTPVLSPTASGEVKVTFGQFEKIEVGMTYKKVVEVFGGEGEKLPPDNTNSKTEIFYRWKHVGYGYFYVAF